MKTVIALLLLSQFTFAAGKLQNEDFKTRAQIEAAGGTQAQLLNDTKIYVTANGINSQLSSAITSGQLGGGGGGGVNFLANGDFEVGPTTSWTLGSGVTAAADTTNFIGGKQSAQLTLASTNGDVISQDVTKACSGINLEHTIWVKTSLTTLQACSKQGASEIQCQSISSNDNWAPISFNSVCPASGTIGIKIKSTSSTSGTVNVDLGYVGTARNIGSVSQASVIATATQPGAVNCIFNENSSTSETNYVDIGTAGSCASAWTTTGIATAVGATSHQVTLTGIPAGDLEVTFNGLAYVNGNGVCNFQVSDGTTTAFAGSSYANPTGGGGPGPMVAVFRNYAGGTKTFKLQASDNFAGSCDIGNNASGRSIDWVFKRYPTSTQQAVNINLQPAYYSGYHDGTCSWSRTNTAYGAFTADASCSLVGRKSSGITAVATGSTLPALALTLPTPGKYMVCAKVAVFGSGATQHSVRLTDGTNVLVQGSDNSNAEPDEKNLCGILDASTTSATVSLEAASTSGSVVVQHNGISGGGEAITWNIWPVGQNYNVPIIVGSVSSNSIGAERIERVKLSNTGAACNIGLQSGSWVTACARNSAGDVTATIATGIFSATPNCLVTPTSGSGNVTTRTATLSTTSVQIQTASAGTPSDANIDVICMGPR